MVIARPYSIKAKGLSSPANYVPLAMVLAYVCFLVSTQELLPYLLACLPCFTY